MTTIRAHIEATLAAIESTHQYQAPAANVAINAPLALHQCYLKGSRDALRRALLILDEDEALAANKLADEYDRGRADGYNEDTEVWLCPPDGPVPECITDSIADELTELPFARITTFSEGEDIAAGIRATHGRCLAENQNGTGIARLNDIIDGARERGYAEGYEAGIADTRKRIEPYY